MSAKDPVTAISEAEARGDIAELYADIRATLGVPVVNLIWRHLASIEGALPWAWQAVRPAYQSGAVVHHAERLKAGLVLPVMEPVPAEVLGCLGLDAGQRQSIRQVLDSYDRSNPMNWLALSALMLTDEGHVASAAQARGGRAANDASVTSRADLPDAKAAEPTPGASDAPASPRATTEALPTPLLSGAALDFTLPALPALDDLAPGTRALVLRLNDLGAERGDAILASMYRHLAHWPPMLALIWAQLSAMARDGRLQKARAQVADHGAREARQLCAALPASAAIAAHPAGRAALADFLARVGLPRMIAITTMLRAALREAAH
ncbi:MAG: hypothetical protein KAY46_09215 [Burkholderiaceae bacterium]|nr:hypothetical protein [Burkholderiaceae bacterium]